MTRPAPIAAAPPGPSRHLVERACSGERAAQVEVYRALRPVIHATVARAFARCRPGYRSDPRGARLQAEDLVHDVFLKLFDGDPPRLLEWDPARGTAFIRRVSWNLAVDKLKAKARSAEVPTAPADLPGVRDRVEERYENVDRFVRAYRQVERAQTPEGRQLMHAMLVEHVPDDELMSRFGFGSRNAVQVKRSALRKKLRSALAELDGGAA